MSAIKTNRTFSQILDKLTELYPDADTELNFSNPYELTVAVILSAQCTDKKVNQVTPVLFLKAPNFRSLAALSSPELEKIIGSINYYRTKSKHLIEMAKIVTSQYSGELPTSMEELIQLPGIGRKTASVILGELGHEQTLPVDTHVFRVSLRLGISKGKNVLQVEDSLRRNYKPEKWRALHHSLILHGRRICIAQNPRCNKCGLSKLCPYTKNK